MAVDDGKWQDVAVLQHGEKESKEKALQKEVRAEA